MGGRGAGSSGGTKTGTSGGGNVTIVSTTSLVSDRERNQVIVDQVLGVAQDMYGKYGSQVSDLQIAELSSKDVGVLAYHDGGGNIAFNKFWWNEQKITRAYNQSVADGYHPSQGSRTAIEATAAHEYGHHIAADVAARHGRTGFGSVDYGSNLIVKNAMKSMGRKNWDKFAGKISGYAQYNKAETVAEAVADVYCNGRKARRESRAIVTVIHELLK